MSIACEYAAKGAIIETDVPIDNSLFFREKNVTCANAKGERVPEPQIGLSNYGRVGSGWVECDWLSPHRTTVQVNGWSSRYTDHASGSDDTKLMNDIMMIASDVDSDASDWRSLPDSKSKVNKGDKRSLPSSSEEINTASTDWPDPDERSGRRLGGNKLLI